MGACLRFTRDLGILKSWGRNPDDRGNRMQYEAPTSVEDAVALLANGIDDIRVLAGGTDLLVQLRAGSALFDLVEVDSPLGRMGGPPPGDGARNVDHIALWLPDFDEGRLRIHLEAHGVEPGEVASRYGARGMGPSMYIRDPDGNVVELKGPAPA